MPCLLNTPVPDVGSPQTVWKEGKEEEIVLAYTIFALFDIILYYIISYHIILLY